MIGCQLEGGITVKKLLLRFTVYTMIAFVVASPAFAITESCVPYPPSVTYQQVKPDIQIKEADNGKGEATILVPFRNDERSWWEFWKSDYVYKEAKMPTKDLPKQDKPWWKFW